MFDEYKTARDEVEYRYLEKMLRKLGYDPSESEMESVYEHLDVYCKLFENKLDDFPSEMCCDVFYVGIISCEESSFRDHWRVENKINRHAKKSMRKVSEKRYIN